MNINGIGSAWEQGLKHYIRELAPDVFCMQEIRTDRNLGLYFIPEYHEYYCPSDRPGYAGVGLFTRHQPRMLIQGLGKAERAYEGRAITMETKDFFIVNVYAPAAGADLGKLGYKAEWMTDLKRYVMYLEGKKPVIICGDMNVAASAYDLPYDCTDEASAGNTDIERAAFNSLLSAGYEDVWRLAHYGQFVPTWSEYRWRDNSDHGWRLDYFLVSASLIDRVMKCDILPFAKFSDHKAVLLEIKNRK